MDAADQFDQRGFAGAVLADQTMDFAGHDVPVDRIERDDAAEPLRRVRHFEKGRRQHRRGPNLRTERLAANIRGAQSAAHPARPPTAKDQRPIAARPSTVPLSIFCNLAARMLRALSSTAIAPTPGTSMPSLGFSPLVSMTPSRTITSPASDGFHI